MPEPDPDESTSAEHGALAVDRPQKSMLELIEDLSPEQQQVLTLKFVFNFANAEAATILGKTEGAIKSLQHRALVSLQKQLEKREAARVSAVALEVGIVGPAGSGQDVALHRADAGPAAASTARRTSAWRRSPTRGSTRSPRSSARARSRRRRSACRTCPAPARRSSGTCDRSTRCSSSSPASAPDADPAGDLETFKLELLVADRDHVERRLERVEKQAKSGDAKLRAEVEELKKVLAHVDAGGALIDYAGELPPELEPLTTKPLIASRTARAAST